MSVMRYNTAPAVSYVDGFGGEQHSPGWEGNLSAQVPSHGIAVPYTG